MTYLAHIDDHRYAVADQSVGVLKASILEAVRGGGDFIEVPVVSGALVRVLITATSKARIEQIPAPPEETDDDGDVIDIAFYDLDM